MKMKKSKMRKMQESGLQDPMTMMGKRHDISSTGFGKSGKMAEKKRRHDISSTGFHGNK